MKLSFMVPFNIEPISEQTIPSAAELMLALWEDSSYEEEYESCKAILKAKNEACYLVKESQRVIGFIHVTLRSDYVEGADSSPTAYIEGLYVSPAYRKLGVASLLIREAEDWARRKQCSQLASDTEFHNTESIAFHQRSGFKIANRIVCFIKDL